MALQGTRSADAAAFETKSTPFPIQGGIQPSPHQQHIFDTYFDLPAGGAILCRAAAGSGKTTTGVMLVERMSKEEQASTLFCAFNKDIQLAAEEKFRQRAPLVTVKTFHALGFATINRSNRNLGGGQIQVDDKKYRHLLELFWITKGRNPNDKVQAELMGEAFKLCRFVRVTLTHQTHLTAIVRTAMEREILLEDEAFQAEAVQTVLAWGVEGTPRPDKTGCTFSWQEVIDFDDMIWLPSSRALDLMPAQFGTVIVDECQDLNRAQRELVFKCCKPGGKKVFVGDPHQAIYAFMGADAQSYEEIREDSGAVECPLSVCYRCPAKVIEFAQTIVPEIEAAPGAPEGIVSDVNFNFFEQQVTNKDMVLCRINAPLIEVAFRLLRQRKRAKVRGRDIGASIAKTVESIAKQYGFLFEDFHLWADTYRANQMEMLARKKDSEQLLISMMDRVDSAVAIYEGAVENGAGNLGDLRWHLESLFADDDQGAILLSSIHKAKGLEADRVFLLMPEKLPHPMAKTAAQQEQEFNLKYVAITRAMKELYIVETPEEMKRK